MFSGTSECKTLGDITPCLDTDTGGENKVLGVRFTNVSADPFIFIFLWPWWINQITAANWWAGRDVIRWFGHWICIQEVSSSKWNRNLHLDEIVPREYEAIGIQTPSSGQLWDAVEPQTLVCINYISLILYILYIIIYNEWTLMATKLYVYTWFDN